jgi:crotonobetainyl-CoA:carnitine CoA-transferase CaiB-like acyl-CoA transferase
MAETDDTVDDSRRALRSLRVIDLSTLFSAPQIGAMLGDLGAEVIKVEPREGDPLRRLGVKRDGFSLMFAMVGRNKRSITLDLSSSSGQAVFRRLLSWGDVIIENYPEPLLRRWGLTYRELVKFQPRLVMISVSGYGRDGPYKDRPGAGGVAEAFGGLSHLTGEADGPPTMASVAVGDVMASLWGTIGALAACYYRDAAGGGGQHVDIAMYEPVLFLIAGAIASYNGSMPVPTRHGNRTPGATIRNAYRTQDGQWLIVSANTSHQVSRLRSLIESSGTPGPPDWGPDDDAVDAAVASWIGDRPWQEAYAELLNIRVPASPANDVSALIANPHLSSRHSLQPMDDERLGKMFLVNPPKMSLTPAGARWLAPSLGAHNRDVYGRLLGLSNEEINQLEEEGVI